MPKIALSYRQVVIIDKVVQRYTKIRAEILYKQIDGSKDRPDLNEI